MIKHQHISYLVMISFVLMTCIFDQLVILYGEIRCLSLLGPKGLSQLHEVNQTVIKSVSQAGRQAVIWSVVRQHVCQPLR